MRGTGLAVRAPGLLAAHAPGLAVKAAGGGARVTATVLGKAAGPLVPLAGVSQRLGRWPRNTRSEVHLPSAAAEAASADSSVSGSPRHNSIGSGTGRRKLVRALSTPDSASLLPPEQALAAESSRAVGDAPAGADLGMPVRALARQSSNIASAVLSRLSRGSASGGGSRRGRSTLGSSGPAGPEQSVLDAAADAAIAATDQGQSSVAASDASPAGGSDAAAAEQRQQRQQRERRLQEQALAELAVLAGPAAAMRPPELPSAASIAEAAELRLQEQRAFYQRQQLRHPTMPASTLAARLAAAEAGGGGVLRTVTAPPAVADMLAGIAAEQQQQQQQQQHAQPPRQPPPQQRQSGQHYDQQSVVPSGRSHGWDSAGDDASLPGGSASYQSAGGSSSREHAQQGQPVGPSTGKRPQLQAVPSGVCLPEAGERARSGAAAAADALATVTSGDTLSPAGSGDPPGGQMAAGEQAAEEAPATGLAGEPTGEGVPVNAPAGQPSMLRRLLSAAAAPWRGRSISGTAEAGHAHGGSPDAPCHSSSVSMSVGSVAPWAHSLAELSSEWQEVGWAPISQGLFCQLWLLDVCWHGMPLHLTEASAPFRPPPCRRAGPAGRQHHQPGGQPLQRQPLVWQAQRPQAAVQRHLALAAGRRRCPRTLALLPPSWTAGARCGVASPANRLALCSSGPPLAHASAGLRRPQRRPTAHTAHQPGRPCRPAAQHRRQPPGSAAGAAGAAAGGHAGCAVAEGHGCGGHCVRLPHRRRPGVCR